MIRGFAIAIGIALVLFAPAIATARPRLAIVELDGDSDREMQDTLAEVLDEAFVVIVSRQVTQALERLDLDTDLSTKQLKKLAKDLNAAVIIRGEVKKKGSHRVLHVRLFREGKKLRGFRVEFASARSRKFKSALKDKLLESLGEPSARSAEPVAAAEDDTTDEQPVTEEPAASDDTASTDDEPQGDENSANDEAAEEEPKKAPEPSKKKKKRTAKRGDEGDADGGEQGGGEEPPVVHGRTLNRDAARLDLGPSLSHRSLSFTSRAFDDAPKPYSNSTVPGARFAAELYPLAFGNPNSIASGIGIGGEFDQTLSLNLSTTVQPGTTFPVKQFHWAVGARMRVVLGSKPTSVGLVFKAGLTGRTFRVDRSQLMEGNIIDLPDVAYRGYFGGAEGRFPVSPRVTLFAGANLILVMATGDIQTADQYGQAKVTAGEAQFGVDVAIGKRFALRALGDFAQMGYAFTGTGELANNRDGDPSTKDIGGATDRYLGGALLFGVYY